MQPPVGTEEELQSRPALLVEVVPPRQQVVLLPLDERPGRSRQAGVLVLADGVEGRAQVAQDMELVEDDLGLWCVTGLERRGAKGLPHVHDGQADSAGFRGAEPGIEGIHAGLGAVGAAEPDGPAAEQVTDDDAVRVPGADGEFVDADDLGARAAGSVELLPHVLLVELLDGVPLEEQVLGRVLDGGDPAVASDPEGKAPSVMRVVGDPVEAFASSRPGTAGRRHGGRGLPGRRAGRRSRGRGPGAGPDRRTSGGWCRTDRRMFFSTPTEADDDGVGIAEEAANGRGGYEARERVQVAESAEVGHAAIVTSLAPGEKCKIATKIRGFRRSAVSIHPHESPKSRNPEGMVPEVLRRALGGTSRFRYSNG